MVVHLPVSQSPIPGCYLHSPAAQSAAAAAAETNTIRTFQDTPCIPFHRQTDRQTHTHTHTYVRMHALDILHNSYHCKGPPLTKLARSHTAKAYSTLTTPTFILVFTENVIICSILKNINYYDHIQKVETYVRYEVFTVVTMKIVVFWDRKPQFVLHRRHIMSLLQSSAS
jgi:hypothetical protein